jgi:hypothetical protein
MMPLGFGEFADTIHKIERFAKVLKLKFFPQMMLVNDFPPGQLSEHRLNLIALHWWHAAATGNAFTRC